MHFFLLLIDYENAFRFRKRKIPVEICRYCSDFHSLLLIQFSCIFLIVYRSIIYKRIRYIMPLMTKIRESMSTIFAIFAGVFVVYIVLDWGMDITGRKHASRSSEAQQIGTIDGKPILYTEFADLVRKASENQKTQAGTEPDENQLKAIRDQIWNQLVDQRLYDDQIKRLGITVTDQEIIDWVRGDNPPDFLRQQFTDSTGNFNRQAYESAIMDPRNKALMVNVEDYLRKQREREKLQSIVLASVRVSEGDVLQRYMDQNIEYDVDYIFFDPNRLVKDDEVKIIDDDLRRYYNEHSDDYKVEAMRTLKYVLFNEVPSKSDSNVVLAEMEDIMKRVTAGADFIDIAKTYSESPASEAYFKHGELSQEKETAIFSAKADDMVGPVKEADGYHLIKVLDFRQGKNEFIHASHILINIDNNDSAKALKEARDIATQVKSGADFGEMAKKFSKDAGSGARGGDLGWFGKDRMVKPFEEAAFKAKAGQIVGPVRSPFGYHIIKVLAHDNREVKISDIHMSIRVSSQTRGDIVQRAQDFAYLSKEDGFQKEASQSKYTVSETQPFLKNAVVPGIGTSIAVNKFAFNGKLGNTSEVIGLENGYGVFMISDVTDAGVRPFEKVKQNVEAMVKREKKLEKLKNLASELRQMLMPGDSLRKISTKRPDMIVQRAPSFTLAGAIPGIGRDLGFIGEVAALKAGDISNPVTGQRGVYLIKLLGKTPFDSTLYHTTKDNLRSQMMNEKRNRVFADWSDQLKKSADIVDNRDMFYR
jgi:peptidyl-prolyl cis-trans isomerase D